MTISNGNRKNQYTANGSNDTFAYTFKIFTDAEIAVDVDGVTKTLTTHYTVTGEGVDAGGDVVFTTGNIPAADATVTLTRNVPLTQEIDYVENDDFPASSHEEALDRAIMLIQQLQEQIDRTAHVTVNASSSFDGEFDPVGNEGGYLRVKVDGTGFDISSSTLIEVDVSPFMETVLDDTTAAGARTTLELGALAVLNTVGSDQIDADSITPTKIPDASITAAKLASGVGIPTGVLQLYAGITAPAGWLLLNGDTIGSAASAATQASDDYETLFTLFWNSMADAEAAVSGGRGASAAADWAANKTLTMSDMRSSTGIGTGQGSGLTDRTHGALVGTETHTLITAEMPLHGHPHRLAAGEGSGGFSIGNQSPTNYVEYTGTPTGTNGQFIGGTGGGGAHNNMQPSIAFTWIIKY